MQPRIALQLPPMGAIELLARPRIGADRTRPVADVAQAVLYGNALTLMTVAARVSPERGPAFPSHFASEGA